MDTKPGKLIRTERRRMDLSRQQLCDKVAASTGLTARKIELIEMRDRPISLVEAVELCKYLEMVTVEQLIEASEGEA